MTQERVPFATIIAAVCDYYLVSEAYLKSASRHRKVARPRQVAMWLAKQHTKMSFPDIGARLGGRDHTTVMHAVERIESLVLSCPETGNDIANLRDALGISRPAVPSSIAFPSRANTFVGCVLVPNTDVIVGAVASSLDDAFPPEALREVWANQPVPPAFFGILESTGWWTK
jgi:hypothetical protein